MRHVGSAGIEVIPNLSIAVERSDSVAFPNHTITSKVPDGALVLEAHRHRDREPAGGDHRRLDVVHWSIKHNDALGAAFVVERAQQRRRVVPAVSVRLEYAEAPTFLLRPLCPVTGTRDICVRFSQQSGRREPSAFKPED
ncbi:exo-rhamnogalacturonase b [Colletotrichum scovillei]|uniref:Exo-rhamnogalacturonase b n=1 Tax=Colletotrichum scovillei TaxID=1209932 RepID=A0A9P7QYA3_9PEZI|nr:exo-rhamnogalacturonase b [Colletotrichum scovillei]KAG7049146.1 exo-rhamnogalacturonase b [Colletotrichum scovillei]KAG7063888.1 exo-rhamnogalacturonase b [Colletotrichum scovillei]